MNDLSLTFARVDGHVLVKIAGDLDGYTADQVSDALVDGISAKTNRLRGTNYTLGNHIL